ncbi:LmeA family phospholipid-binding protein [Gordonia zhaorongruii]|uniref:LmeA family phospholipid-binding protein n=1 Tax=Gordonia zhaorongruii TaxID=2597659 RepID=UPI001051D35D|nr:LmeA family phospholipid-binding protein [Gordonia zhaorongruii]
MTDSDGHDEKRADDAASDPAASDLPPGSERSPWEPTPSDETAQPAPGPGGAAPTGSPDAPTGEVRTGPIDPNRLQPGAEAYSQANRPPTRQMDAVGTGGFAPPTGSGSAEFPPAGPQQPVPHSAPTGGKRGRRRTIALVCSAVVLLLVIAGVGSELYLRHKVTSCMETAFGDLTGAPTDVSVSRKPVILSAFGSDVPWVQVDTADGDSTQMRLHARAEGISTDGGSVQSMNGNGFLPYDRVTELSSGGGASGGPAIEKITADEGAGTLKVNANLQMIISVPVSVTLKPKLTDGKVTFDVTDASALVFGVPQDFAQPIVDQMTKSMFGPMFDQITIQEFAVKQSGVDFGFSGHDVDLKSASTGNQNQSSDGCSV